MAQQHGLQARAVRATRDAARYRDRAFYSRLPAATVCRRQPAVVQPVDHPGPAAGWQHALPAPGSDGRGTHRHRDPDAAGDRWGLLHFVVARAPLGDGAVVVSELVVDAGAHRTAAADLPAEHRGVGPARRTGPFRTGRTPVPRGSRGHRAAGDEPVLRRVRRAGRSGERGSRTSRSTTPCTCSTRVASRSERSARTTCCRANSRCCAPGRPPTVRCWPTSGPVRRSDWGWVPRRANRWRSTPRSPFQPSRQIPLAP